LYQVADSARPDLVQAHLQTWAAAFALMSIAPEMSAAPRQALTQLGGGADYNPKYFDHDK